MQAPPLAAVGLISAAALAYEILLTRLFATIHWHHLVATAIGLALLGYGASGTFVSLLRVRLEAHYSAVFVGCALLFAASSLVCVALARQIPLDPEALAWDIRQIAYLTATFLLLALPFFAAATCIGLTLTRFGRAIPRVYGADLVGAGAGAALLLPALALWPAADVLFGLFACGMLVATLAAYDLRWHPRRVGLVAVLAVAGVWLWARPEIHPAAYKDLARAMTVMGATRDAERAGVAGQLTVVRNDRVPLRTAPGLSLLTPVLPPRQLAVFIDGDAHGALGDFSGGDIATAYLGHLTSALPYGLVDSPRVAVLNAGVGASVQQALSLGAASVTAVEPNPLMPAIRCGRYGPDSGAVCDADRVDWRIQSARAQLAVDTRMYDLIVLGVQADAAGLNALSVDFDLTREAFVLYLSRLTPRGMLVIDGPTRTPPRLALRMLATVRAALQDSGQAQPRQHIAMIRGWQRFTLLAAARPLDATAIEQVRRFAAMRGFDLVWTPDIVAADTNRYQRLPSPLFHDGAAALLEPHRTAGEAAARVRLQPASDDRPFPYLSTQWTQWWQAWTAGGRADRAQLDAGLLAAGLTLPIVALVAVVLILLPLWVLRGRADDPVGRVPRGRTLAYFGVLGFAFLCIEIAWIQRLQLFLGHPVYATTAVLAVFLIVAGLGSLWAQQRDERRSKSLLLKAVLAIAVLCVAYVVWLPGWLSALSHLALGARIAIVAALLAPLAFTMGIPFPLGLRSLADGAAQLVPWAWGINGCLSVIAAVATPLLAVEIGFHGLILLAAGGYLTLPWTTPSVPARTAAPRAQDEDGGVRPDSSER